MATSSIPQRHILKTRSAAATLFLIALTARSATAQTTWHVDLTNCPGPGSGTLADPFCKIQDGIDAAADGDTVTIADGVYAGIGNKNLQYHGKAITVQSDNGPLNCIIDCQQEGRGFWFHKGETAASVLDGLTIKNGNVLTHGGGVLCVLADPTIQNCLITNNSDSGIYCSFANPVISNCTIASNTTSIAGGGGGGIYAEGGNVLITSSIISSNSASNGGSGGGVRADFAVLINCTVQGNWAGGQGGGISSGEGCTITGCTISANSASNGGGFHGSGTLSDSQIMQNSAASGGGVYVLNGDVVGCAVADNTASSFAGGVYAFGGSVSISDCMFLGNNGGSGGAIYSKSSNSHQVIGCTLWENWATSNGGAIGCESAELLIRRCDIRGNIAGLNGGGVYGGVSGDPHIDNCTIRANEAGALGGGIAIDVTPGGTVAIANSRLVANHAWQHGGAISCYYRNLTIANCTVTKNSSAWSGSSALYAAGNQAVTISESIFWENNSIYPTQILLYDSQPPGVIVSHCDISGGPSAVSFNGSGGASLTWSNNIDADPLFHDSENHDYHLLFGSPCIDAGNPAFIPEPGETDMDEEPRVSNEIVDLGADEYHDCNSNGVADYLDLAEGTSGDCNETNVPDECEGFACNDDDACTSDTCDHINGCVFTSVDCDDGDACTTEGCEPQDGCIHTSIDCDDLSVCTSDSCDPASGCSNAPFFCEDGDVCTIDACAPLTGCFTTPVICDPQDECTFAVCDPVLGCIYPPIVCDDMDACTTDECGPGVGCFFTPINCDDNDACTEGGCDPAAGCLYTPIETDDGDPCTVDTCDQASGVMHTPVQCPKGQECNPASGLCIATCPTDLNDDGDTDAADLAQLLGAWGPNPGHSADFNGDETVNAADLALLLGGWGTCV